MEPPRGEYITEIITVLSLQFSQMSNASKSALRAVHYYYYLCFLICNSVEHSGVRNENRMLTKCTQTVNILPYRTVLLNGTIIGNFFRPPHKSIIYFYWTEVC